MFGMFRISKTARLSFPTVWELIFRAEHGHGIRRRTFVVVRFGLYHLSRHGADSAVSSAGGQIRQKAFSYRKHAVHGNGIVYRVPFQKHLRVHDRQHTYGIYGLSRYASCLYFRMF